jgi:exopolysaccharide biosynthesis WecB/TagA/CpsF family protein
MNAHCFNTMRCDSYYTDAVASADAILPDGIGVGLAVKMTADWFSANLNGTDFVPHLLKEAARMGKTVFLFGGTPGTADVAAHRLVRSTLGSLRGRDTGWVTGASDPEAVIAQINESGADIILVALGVPLQELLLHKHAHRIDAPLTMAVGALFDFLAGTVSRAPQWFRPVKMEWNWRQAQKTETSVETLSCWQCNVFCVGGQRRCCADTRGRDAAQIP